MATTLRAEASRAKSQRRPSRLTTDLVWRELDKASFAVVSHVTAGGLPRSSGVVYSIVGRRLYVAVAKDGWKAKDIAANGHVAVTVPIRRGGLLSLLLPIPPATVSFHGTAVVRPNGWTELRSELKKLDSLMPPEERGSGSIIEIVPEDRFLTYGVGVSLLQMRSPAIASGHVAVESSRRDGLGDRVVV